MQFVSKHGGKKSGGKKTGGQKSGGKKTGGKKTGGKKTGGKKSRYRCQLCKIVVTANTINKTRDGTIFKKNFDMTCKTRDLVIVYVLICKSCKHE